MSSHPTRRARAAFGTAVLTLGLTAMAADPARSAPTPVPVGTPPVAVITVPGTVYAGVPATLSGARSTSPDGAIAEWEWDLDDDGRFERASTSSPFTTKTFKAGSRTVSLRVRGEGGLVSTAMKTVTVRKPAPAVLEPTAPTAVDAQVDGTTIAVTWQESLGSAALTYRVSLGSDSGDVIFVPATEPAEVSFENVVPGTYAIAVAAVNAAGTGPSTEIEATILAKGASSSPEATASGSPDATLTAGATGTPTATTAGAGQSDADSDPAPIGLALIGAGIALLLVAAGTALLGLRRRRSAH